MQLPNEAIAEISRSQDPVSSRACIIVIITGDPIVRVVVSRRCGCLRDAVLLGNSGQRAVSQLEAGTQGAGQGRAGHPARSSRGGQPARAGHPAKSSSLEGGSQRSDSEVHEGFITDQLSAVPSRAGQPARAVMVPIQSFATESLRSTC